MNSQICSSSLILQELELLDITNNDSTDIEDLSGQAAEILSKLEDPKTRALKLQNRQYFHKLDPHQCEVLYADVNRLLQAGCQDTAELIGLSMIAIAAKPDIGIKSYAISCEMAKRYDKTVIIAKEVLLHSPGNIEASYQLAFALNELGRADEALEVILPALAMNEQPRMMRLAAISLSKIGLIDESMTMFERAIAANPSDLYSCRALSDAYMSMGLFSKAAQLIQTLPQQLRGLEEQLYESVIYRSMGDLERAIAVTDQVLKEDPGLLPAIWMQIFNYSIADSASAHALLELTNKHWELLSAHSAPPKNLTFAYAKSSGKRRIGFITADLGEHVVSRFLSPLLRSYDRKTWDIELFSMLRRFEAKAESFASLCSNAFSLEGESLQRARALVKSRSLDAIIETGGYTRDSGLGILGERCAPIQCEYIGFHATTGLPTIDYFIGDHVLTPTSLQHQFTEKLLQMPRIWMAYDSQIEFPIASSTSRRDAPVFGCFSQVSKISAQTLDYWAAALVRSPEAILVIKDRGVHCESTCQRLVAGLEARDIDPQRIFLFGHVPSHLDHLDSYNAIDIALDTTPWCGATTAFESLGMGVPLVAILGDTTSGRMSSSVVNAAGMAHLIAHDIQEFAAISGELAHDYKNIRSNKAKLQQKARSGILFDSTGICEDFYGLMNTLISHRKT